MQGKLRNVLSIKLLGESGIAVIPEADEGVSISPSIQMGILITLVDFFVNSVPEEVQTTLEDFFLDNFRSLCENRHETTSIHKVNIDDLES